MLWIVGAVLLLISGCCAAGQAYDGIRIESVGLVLALRKLHGLRRAQQEDLQEQHIGDGKAETWAQSAGKNCHDASNKGQYDGL